jgi:hypothetical protein
MHGASWDFVSPEPTDLFDSDILLIDEVEDVTDSISDDRKLNSEDWYVGLDDQGYVSAVEISDIWFCIVLLEDEGGEHPIGPGMSSSGRCK